MAGEACMQTYGGFAFAEEYDIERKWRETRLYQVPDRCPPRCAPPRPHRAGPCTSGPYHQIAPISTNLILSYLSEHVLGLPRSY